MNQLQCALIEKASHDHCFEHVLTRGSLRCSARLVRALLSHAAL